MLYCVYVCCCKLYMSSFAGLYTCRIPVLAEGTAPVYFYSTQRRTSRLLCAAAVPIRRITGLARLFFRLSVRYGLLTEKQTKNLVSAELV